MTLRAGGKHPFQFPSPPWLQTGHQKQKKKSGWFFRFVCFDLWYRTLIPLIFSILILWHSAVMTLGVFVWFWGLCCGQGRGKIMRIRCSGALTDYQFVAWLPAFGMTSAGASIFFSYFLCHKTTLEISMPHRTSINHKVLMRSSLSQPDLPLGKGNVHLSISYLRKTYPRMLANITFEKE